MLCFYVSLVLTRQGMRSILSFFLKQVINLEPEVRVHYYKSISAKLCPPVSGQAVIDCIVNPPKPGI